MRSSIGLVVLAVAAAGARPVAAVVYGPDDRRDLYQLDSPQLLAVADASVGLFFGPAVGPDRERPGFSKILGLEHGPFEALCKDDRFYRQPMAAFCSGVLIAPDVVLTAGHCVPSGLACRAIKFLFGYSIRRAGDDPARVATSDVYGCGKLILRRRVREGPDWALVRLDRAVTDHHPAALDEAAPPAEGTGLAIVGHPDGLPTKAAGGAIVRSRERGERFTANLDAFAGNSGSPVLNAATGLVEGVLNDGERDYAWRRGCRAPKRCPDDGCRGEVVTSISEVLHDAPRLDGRALDLGLPF